MEEARRRQLVAKYIDGYRAVAEALERLGPERLDVRSAPGEWSARQIVHHLADAEMTGAIRLRRLLAEERPEIVAYDEEEYARRLHYDRPLGASLEALDAARRAPTARPAATRSRPGLRCTRSTLTTTQRRSSGQAGPTVHDDLPRPVLIAASHA